MADSLMLRGGLDAALVPSTTIAYLVATIVFDGGEILNRKSVTLFKLD